MKINIIIKYAKIICKTNELTKINEKEKRKN